MKTMLCCFLLLIATPAFAESLCITDPPAADDTWGLKNCADIQHDLKLLAQREQQARVHRAVAQRIRVIESDVRAEMEEEADRGALAVPPPASAAGLSCLTYTLGSFTNITCD